VFGGAVRGSGRTFLVPVPNRTADTLTAFLREWIEPGTTVISDCWGAYRDFDSLGYTHRTVNRSLYFVDPDTGDHTNTIESTWHRLKASWDRTTGQSFPVTISLTTRSRRGAGHKECHLSYNSCISSRAPIGPVFN